MPRSPLTARLRAVSVTEFWRLSAFARATGRSLLLLWSKRWRDCAFSLYADCRKGRRPSFTGALSPDRANEFYIEFVNAVADETGVSPKTGEFGADMKVELLNDGPVTIMLDSDDIIK